MPNNIKTYLQLLNLIYHIECTLSCD